MENDARYRSGIWYQDMAGKGAPLGNTYGARNSKPFYDQLRKILAQEDLTLTEKNRSLHKIATVLIKHAVKGEEWAIKELINRTDGKAVQGVELSDPEGNAINIFSASAIRNVDPKKLEQLKALLTEVGVSVK